MSPSRGYSTTVKQEVVQLIESGLSIAAAAQRANISPSTARRWWKTYEADGPEALGIGALTTVNDPALLETTDSQALRTSRNTDHIEDENEVKEGETEEIELVAAGDDATEIFEPTGEPFDLAAPPAEQDTVDIKLTPRVFGRDDEVPTERTGSESGGWQAWKNFKANLNGSINDAEIQSLRASAAIIGIILAVAGIIWVVDLTTDASAEDCWASVTQSEIVLTAIVDGTILWDPFWTERFANERSALNWVGKKRDWFFSECRQYPEEEVDSDELQRILIVFGLRP